MDQQEIVRGIALQRIVNESVGHSCLHGLSSENRFIENLERELNVRLDVILCMKKPVNDADQS